MVESIRDTQPIAHPCDDGAIWRLALVYRRIEASAVALDAADQAVATDPLGAYGQSASWLGRLRDDHDRWLARASRIEAELGRTPSSRAKLGLNLALRQRAMNVVELHREAALEEAERADEGVADGGA
jgi:hypothetical protein